MKKLSIILLLSFTSGHIVAMGDGGEFTPAAYPQEAYPQQQQFYGMAGAQPAPQMAPAALSQAALHLTALYNNNEQLLAALTAQQNICLNNRDILAALIAIHSVDGAAVPAGPSGQQNNNLLRAQQALAQLEQEDAPKRIKLLIEKAQQQLRERFRTSIERDCGMGKTAIVKLEGKELEDAIEAYVGRMNTVESSLMALLEDPYLPDDLSDQVIKKLLPQARQQAHDAKNAGLKQPSPWAQLNNSRWTGTFQ